MTRLQCTHCGYAWDYTRDKDVTSCPKCGWRVRIRTTQASQYSRPAGDITSRTAEQTRYY